MAQKKFGRILGVLGWLLLGIVLMRHEIGPWWIGWTSLTISSIALIMQIEDLLFRKEKCEI